MSISGPPWGRLGALLEQSWGPLGALLVLSWSLLEHSWGSLEPREGSKGAPRGQNNNNNNNSLQGDGAIRLRGYRAKRHIAKTLQGDTQANF
eukprot:3205698-Pyramimonas_sp.AAC.1